MLYKKCDIPLDIIQKQYSDFTSNYKSGILSLQKAISITFPSEIQTVSSQHPTWLVLASLFIAVGGIIIIYLLFFQKEVPISTDGLPTPPHANLAAIQIFSEPSGAAVFFDGQPVGMTPFDSALSNNTTVKLRLQKPNHFLVDTSFVVRRSEDSTFSFALKPAARVSIKANPANAEFRLDGKPIRRAQLADTMLAVGPHHIEISAIGYIPLTKQFNLTEGLSLERTYTLEKIIEPPPPPVGSINITSEPPYAAILLNEVVVDSTPATISQLRFGQYKLALRKKGYQDSTLSIIVDSRQMRTINIKLQSSVQPSQSGSLNVLVLPYGSIYINGKLQKENFDRQFRTQLAVGAHLLKVTHPQFGKWEKQITIKAEELRDLRIDFNKMVKLKITATPVDGEIFVDGASRGYTTKELWLRIGQHRLEVRQHGYVGETQIIGVEEEMKKTILFMLKKIE